MPDTIADTPPPEPERRLLALLRADASDEEIDEFLAVLNEGMPED